MVGPLIALDHGASNYLLTRYTFALCERIQRFFESGVSADCERHFAMIPFRYQCVLSGGKTPKPIFHLEMKLATQLLFGGIAQRGLPRTTSNTILLGRISKETPT
jgi:hypothetical protein